MRNSQCTMRNRGERGWQMVTTTRRIHVVGAAIGRHFYMYASHGTAEGKTLPAEESRKVLLVLGAPERGAVRKD